MMLGGERMGGGRDVELAGIFFLSSRRQHTRYWRDWSSDVCSSDLHGAVVDRALELRTRHAPTRARRRRRRGHRVRVHRSQREPRGGRAVRPARRPGPGGLGREIGRESWRERVLISVVAVSLKKKQN